MDPQGGVQSVENLRQAGNGQGKMYVISHAGHHGMCYLSFGIVTSLIPIPVYLDNPKAVNDLLIKELDRT